MKKPKTTENGSVTCSSAEKMHDRTTDSLISRQAAIDALEKVAALFPWRVPGNRDSYDHYNEAWNDAIGRAEIEIEELPSVQSEIIHCRKCKWHNGEINQCNAQICASMRGEDFCSRAERITDET